VLPPGDVRKALLALADPASKMAPLLAYRFVKGELAGHPVGNLVLAALTDLKGGFIEAVEAMSRLLGLQGRVLPSTLMPVELRGRVDGRQALVGRPEQVVYVCNLESQQAETTGFLPEADLAALLAHCPGLGSGGSYASGRPTRRHVRVRCMPSPSSRPKWYMPSW